MKQKAINVVQSQLAQGVVKTPFNIFRLEKMDPDLRRDEDVLSLYAGVLGEEFSYASSDLNFIPVTNIP